MNRAVLLVALAIAVLVYFPPSRDVVAHVARPALTPVLRWVSLHQMTRIVREVQLYERESYGQLPDQRRFPVWIAGRLNEGITLDPWGRPYLFVIGLDSFAVVSWGPDGLPQTDDDLRVARVRVRSGR